MQEVPPASVERCFRQAPAASCGALGRLIASVIEWRRAAMLFCSRGGGKPTRASTCNEARFDITYESSNVDRRKDCEGKGIIAVRSRSRGTAWTGFLLAFSRTGARASLWRRMAAHSTYGLTIDSLISVDLVTANGTQPAARKSNRNCSCD